MKRFLENAIPLVLAEGEAAAPKWIRVVPSGTVRTVSYPPFQVDRGVMDRIIAAYKAAGLDVVIDFEHQTLGGDWSSPDGTAPAAGWIKDLEPRDDGLWALVDWTERGGRAVAAREYRYLSPVLLPGKSPARLHSVALTNTPQIRGMAPLVAKDLNEENDMKTLREVLGLAPDATDEAVVAAVQILEDGRKATVLILGLKPEAQASEIAAAVKDLMALKASAVESLALSQAVKPEELRGAVIALRNPANTVPAVDFLALKARLDDRDAEDLVAKAIADGKVTPAQRDWAKGYACKDRPGFEAFVAQAPVVVASGRVVPPAASGGGTGAGLTEYEAMVCGQLKLDPKKYQAEKAGQEG